MSLYNVKFALMGEKGSGKSYIAQTLEQTMSNAQQIAFADPLKSITGFIFNWIPESVDTPLNKELPIVSNLNTNNLSYREIIVEVAAILNRIESGIFIRKTVENINFITKDYPELNVFITDVRTAQEVKFCEDNNIPIIKIVTGDNSLYNTSQGATFESFVKQYEAKISFLNVEGKTSNNDIIQFFKGYFK